MRAAIYARVSTVQQDYQMQLTELRAYCQRQGWEVVEYLEKASGKAGGRRPELDKLMRDARLKIFDTVVVWKIDRFGRSLSDFVSNVQSLDRCGVRFVAPNQGIDTDRRSASAKMFMNMLAVFAEFERDLIVERVRAGVAEAQSRGVHCGRPSKVFRRDQAAELRKQGMSWRKISRELRIPQSTIRKALKAD